MSGMPDRFVRGRAIPGSSAPARPPDRRRRHSRQQFSASAKIVSPPDTPGRVRGTDAVHSPAASGSREAPYPQGGRRRGAAPTGGWARPLGGGIPALLGAESVSAVPGGGAGRRPTRRGRGRRPVSLRKAAGRHPPRGGRRPPAARPGPKDGEAAPMSEARTRGRPYRHRSLKGIPRAGGADSALTADAFRRGGPHAGKRGDRQRGAGRRPPSDARVQARPARLRSSAYRASGRFTPSARFRSRTANRRSPGRRTPS